VVTTGGMGVLPRLGLAAGALFAGCVIAVLVRVLRPGSYRRRDDAHRFTKIVWMFLVTMITLLMLVAGRMEDPARGVSLVFTGVVVVILGVVFRLQTTINQASMRTQEKLLELELPMAQLRELLPQG
jgi:choline-glycine betaine transporter